MIESYPPYALTLDGGFVLSVSKLPTKVISQDDQDKYNQFSDAYGQVYPQKIDMGAEVIMDIYVDTELFTQKTVEWTVNQMDLSFHSNLFNISAGGFANRSQIKIDQLFDKYSKSYIFFKGGDEKLQSNETLSKWVESIPNHLIYIKCDFQPIEEFITDQNKKLNVYYTSKYYIQNGKYPTYQELWG